MLRCCCYIFGPFDVLSVVAVAVSVVIGMISILELAVVRISEIMLLLNAKALMIQFTIRAIIEVIFTTIARY